MPFLGHIVSRDGIQADPAKTSAVRQYPVPKTVTEVKSFLGLCSYYRRYVRDFASIARPLHQLTEKSRDFQWNTEAQQAFEQLKDRLTSSPILAFPTMKEPFILYTDASNFAMGAVLAQVQDGLERVICYASKTLNKAQSRYSTTKRELLAVVNYTKHFKHYLLGRRFKIITDHRALQWLHNFKDPDALTARWLEKLAAFDYEIEHRSGKSIGHADCMSRLPSEAAAVNMTTTMDASGSQSDTADVSLPTPSSSNNATDSTTEVWNSDENPLTDNEQSQVDQGNEAGNETCFKMNEQQGNLLDFPHSIAHCISADFKLGAGIAKEIREKFPDVYPRMHKYDKEQVMYPQFVEKGKYIYHLIVKPRYFHKPTYQTLRNALKAMREHLKFHGVDKLGIPHLSCGLDKLDWNEVKIIIQDVFGDSNLTITVFTLPSSAVNTTSCEMSDKTDLQTAQTEDEGINEVTKWVRNQSRPPRSHLQGYDRNVWQFWNLFDELTIQNDILCREVQHTKTGVKIFQQIVPQPLVQTILHSLHSHDTSAHLGVTKTLEKVRSRFYWPGHKRDVEVFVASCLACQKRNSPPKKHIHSLRAWKPSFPFSTVGIDFLGPLPPSSGNIYILLIGDHFTKWHEAIPLPDQSASTTAKALLDNWITRFGCPESIHSDQGRNFEAKLFKSLMELLQIDKTRTTAFHPQSNAVIERTNRTLLNMLAKTTAKNQQNWSQLVPYVMLAYRTSVHESTGYTPYFLLFGKEVTLPIDLQFPPPKEACWTSYHEYVAETRHLFQTAYEDARQYLKGQQKRQHALYNSKVHGPTYKKGQLILLHCPATPPGLSPKLHSFWRGPYQIEQVISELTYKVRELETNKELIVHYDRMKPCHAPPQGVSVKPPQSTNNSSPTKEVPACTPPPVSCCTCTCDIGPTLPVNTPSTRPTTASVPPPLSVPSPESTPQSVAEDDFPNHSPAVPPPSHQDANLSANCSFNTADSSMASIPEPFPAPFTVPDHSLSTSLPSFTSTPRQPPSSRPILTNEVLDSASSRVHTLSPSRPSYQDCPRPLRSNTMNQRRATHSIASTSSFPKS